MLVVLLGIYPPRTPEGIPQATILREPTGTPVSPNAVGLKIEKVGEPVKFGDTVTVTLRVTNTVFASAQPTGTPEAEAPTPTAGPANLVNGSVKVFFYRIENGVRKIVGSGVGNVVNLPHGASAEIRVVATPVEDFTEWEARPDVVWTDKDRMKTDSSDDGPAGEPGAAPTPGSAPPAPGDNPNP